MSRHAHRPRPHRPEGAVSAALAALGTTLSWSQGLARFDVVARRLERVNFRGRTVSLRGGVGVAAGALAAGAQVGRALGGAAGARPAAAAVAATGAAGAAGLIDDLDAGAHDGQTPAKGLKGHLGALARGRVTTGALKIAVIGSGALVAGVLLARHRSATAAPRRRGATALDAAVSALTIASWADVHNLLDLRPGRALKAAALLTAPLLVDRRPAAAACRALAAGCLGATAAALPGDLMEETMLGDTGANALGALVGTALAAHPARPVRALSAAAGTGLVLASERVSFTRVIARTPALAALDALGRDGV
ncbi:hypothetical protein AM609_07785 [Actinomyces sp. oral taxon 414]|uniref:hypothetical protein n=1 Tax=Actinomyces sp. oral taxon 414 TaxID=712122 RepID=UPI0006AEC7EC|nr:hypothetical protein [Actinomyces sp. oral taxon 414]ALC99413.1 hypothetical protein AM609_07785 [Actinomyces sp. oral taxon 414]